MKKILLLSVAFILFIGCKTKNSVGENGVTYKDAQDYNDYIIHRQEDILRDIMDYGKASKISVDEGDKKLDKMVEDVSVRLQEIRGMAAFKGDSAFRDAAIALFNFYKEGFNIDFREMQQLRRKYDNGTASDEEKTRLAGFSNFIGSKEQKYVDRLKATQAKFAKDNNITLMPNDVEKQMENEMK